MRKWQPSLDKRPKADDVYQRRVSNDEKAIGKARQHNGSRFSPLAEINDEHEMNWQHNTMRQVDDAKEMDTNHLQDDSTLHTTNDTQLSIKKHATQSSINSSKAKKHATKKEIHVLSPTLHLNKKDKMLYVPLQFDKYENNALLDTGAIQSAMSEAELRKITTAHSEAILQELPPPNFKIQIANGNLVPVRKQVLLRFYVAGKVFEETFLILPTMGTILIGMSFFEKYSVNLDIKNHLVHFPNHMMSMQVRQQKNNKLKTGLINLCSSYRTVIPPLHQVMIQVHSDADISLTTGTVEGSPAFMRKTCLLVSPALVDLDEGKTTIQVTNPNNHKFTLDANTTLAHFRIPTPHQAANITPMPVEHLNLITKYPDEAEAVINQLFVNPEMKSTKWYPTPETCSDPNKLNANSTRRIYDEILALRELEKLDTSQSDEQRMNFLKNFNWDESLLTPSQQLQVEELLVKYNSIFARHRFDIGMNTDFKVKLTPQNQEPVYSQSLPTSTNLKDDLLVELALMQEYGIITSLPHSKYSSPIFAQRKPNGKLRILVDLRRINHLIKNDYGEHNHPVTTIADAAQHMAGKKYFCKLDCSQAYHCIAMADEQSVQLLSFNFGS